MSSSTILSPPSMQEQEPDQQQEAVKRRAACEECRTKKLKCSGTHPACTTCVREGISCYYSPQKTMGRPKKRTRSIENHELELDKRSNRRTSEAHSSIQKPDSIVSEAAVQQQEQQTAAEQDIPNSYDMGSYASAFNPDGTLQPWLQQNFPEDLDTSWITPNPNMIPALTPDNDSSSSLGGEASIPSVASLLDQTLSHHQPCKTSTIASCACLSTLYLTLSTLNNMRTASDFSFPKALHPLREAMFSAQTILACEECPKSFTTGLQNTTMLGTLFLSIAERFSKVLEQIDVEAKRAEEGGERKRFRLTDLNGENEKHLHLGGEGCAAAFSLEMSPGEWKAMCKKVVRAGVVGPADGGKEGEELSEGVYFLGLARQMGERQHRWHMIPLPDDFPKSARDVLRPTENVHGSGKKEQHHCLKMVESSKSLVEKFDWN